MRRNVYLKNGENVQCGVSWAHIVRLKWASWKQQEQEGRCALKRGSPSINCWQNPLRADLGPRQSSAGHCTGFVLFWICPPLHGHRCHHADLGAPGLSPGWLCLSAGSHLSAAPVLQPFLSSDVGTAKPSSNHLENQLNLVTKKITLVWNRSFPHALLQCLSSWLSWPVVKCVREQNPALEHWPFLY